MAKKGKNCILLLLLTVLFCLPSLPLAAAGSEDYATRTTSGVVIDGKAVAFDAYNIAYNNYFKLRDVAYALNGTEASFSVDWTNADGQIRIGSASPYLPVGGEGDLGSGDDTKPVKPTTARILYNGAEVHIKGYNIADNNYFKLRDLAQLIDFGVTWNEEGNEISIQSDQEYVGPFAPKKNVAVLLYHTLSGGNQAPKPEEYGVATTAQRFEENLSALLLAGYKPLSLAEFYANDYRMEEKYFIVTFDDGYRSNYVYAYPLLKAYGIHGEIFINTDNTNLAHHFTFAEAYEMETSGVVSIHSHYPSHIYVTGLPRETFFKELNRSFQQLADGLGPRENYFFAYPYGAYNRERYEDARAVGMQLQMVQKKTLDQDDIVLRTAVKYDTDILSLMKRDIYN